MKSKRGKKNEAPKLIGEAFDAQDGHKRMTKADSIVIVGGSKETHEEMQEQAIRMNEEASKRGKDFAELSSRELNDVVIKVLTR